MPSLVSKKDCCGCSACCNSCPSSAISMIADEEGFLHPKVDYNLCVECGACERACPGLSLAKNPDNQLRVLVTQNRNDNIRYESTSGGAFSAIATEILNRGGIVFGAAMSEDFKVKHIGIEIVDQLWRFRNSKYVQSEIGLSYKEAKRYLCEGRWVCFSGTPCQINGLQKFLGKDFEKLITVDVVCKSIPSPLIFQKYVEYKKSKEHSISDIVFRDKYRGFQYCTMAHYSSFENRKKKFAQYRRGSESDEWLRLFLSGIMCRESCISCPYQTRQRVSDFTLGDIWVTGDRHFDDNKGTTLLHIWTTKGNLFYESLATVLRDKNIPAELSRGAERISNPKISPKREQFFKDALVMSPNSFFSKYAPYNTKVKLKNLSRFLLWKLNLQSIVREVKHKFIHRR